MKEKVNRFLSALVRPHVGYYVLAGMILMSVMFELELTFSLKQKDFYLWYIAPPFAFLFLLGRPWLCEHFYAEKYRLLVPNDPYARWTLGTPEPDISYYQTISSNLKQSRRLAGYLYALLKPLTGLGMGLSFGFGIIDIFLS